MLYLTCVVFKFQKSCSTKLWGINEIFSLNLKRALDHAINFSVKKFQKDLHLHWWLGSLLHIWIIQDPPGSEPVVLVDEQSGGWHLWLKFCLWFNSHYSSTARFPKFVNIVCYNLWNSWDQIMLVPAKIVYYIISSTSSRTNRKTILEIRSGWYLCSLEFQTWNLWHFNVYIEF